MLWPHTKRWRTWKAKPKFKVSEIRKWTSIPLVRCNYQPTAVTVVVLLKSRGFRRLASWNDDTWWTLREVPESREIPENPIIREDRGLWVRAPTARPDEIDDIEFPEWARYCTARTDRPSNLPTRSGRKWTTESEFFFDIPTSESMLVGKQKRKQKLEIIKNLIWNQK